jgi:hypothetical protein
MVEAISKIKDAIDERLALCERLLIIGRLGLLPPLFAHLFMLLDHL